MAKLQILVNAQGPDYSFFCPGCECDHGIWTNPNREPCWKFNGNLDKPTFSPSIRVQHGPGVLCHSFVKDGMIEFCTDSTHKLAGQKVELPEIEM